MKKRVKGNTRLIWCPITKKGRQSGTACKTLFVGSALLHWIYEIFYGKFSQHKYASEASS